MTGPRGRRATKPPSGRNSLAVPLIRPILPRGARSRAAAPLHALPSRASRAGRAADLDIPAVRRSGTLPTLDRIMHVEEVTIPFPVSTEPLFTPQRLLAYLALGILEDNHASIEEGFWLIGLTRERRPVFRQRLGLGRDVTSQITPRQVFTRVLSNTAEAFACIRVQYHASVEPRAADLWLLWNLHEVSQRLDIIFADYLITQLDGCVYFSYTERRSEV